MGGHCFGPSSCTRAQQSSPGRNGVTRAGRHRTGGETGQLSKPCRRRPCTRDRDARSAPLRADPQGPVPRRPPGADESQRAPQPQVTGILTPITGGVSRFTLLCASWEGDAGPGCSFYLRNGNKTPPSVSLFLGGRKKKLSKARPGTPPRRPPTHQGGEGAGPGAASAPPLGPADHSGAVLAAFLERPGSGPWGASGDQARFWLHQLGIAGTRCWGRLGPRERGVESGGVSLPGWGCGPRKGCFAAVSGELSILRGFSAEERPPVG